jgi:hypothetical protein
MRLKSIAVAAIVEDWTENPASAHVRITGLGRTSWL